MRSQFEALEHHAFGPEYAFDEAIDKIAEDEGRDKQPENSRYQFQYVHSPAESFSVRRQSVARTARRLWSDRRCVVYHDRAKRYLPAAHSENRAAVDELEDVDH